jgi:molybdopterin synthase catalytic subunit
MSFRLSPDPIYPETPRFEVEEGAEVQFLGTVRGIEAGQTITGIDYSAYLPMAEKTLDALLEKGKTQHGPHRVFIQHRLGFVAVEEPSLLLRVHTKHSAEAFQICQWYLKEIKTTVPIWKKPIPTIP